MLLADATIATLGPPSVERGCLRVEGRLHRGASGRSFAAVPARRPIFLEGALVLPGLANAHTHLYSALARGMPGPRQPPGNFREILERVWWRLDRALDLELVEASALAGGVEAALSGTTLLVDHHSSPSAITASLSRIRGALEQVGLRSLLCYEVTDRNGTEGRDLGLAENLAFAREPARELTRGMIGAHAGFTLSDDSLGLRVVVVATGTGLHVHVAEDRCDVDECLARHGMGSSARLRAHGLLTARTVFAHCVHLGSAEMDEVPAQAAGWCTTRART